MSEVLRMPPCGYPIFSTLPEVRAIWYPQKAEIEEQFRRGDQVGALRQEARVKVRLAALRRMYLRDPEAVLQKLRDGSAFS